jgi:predicted enzyme related to lactoylglutathione lyase
MPVLAFLNAMPVLAVRDLVAAMGFYRDVFGFSPYVRELPRYAQVGRDGVEIGLTQDPENAGRDCCQLQVQGIDELYAYCVANARIIKPLSEREFGFRDFVIEDPDGNRLTIGECLEPMDAA